MEIQMSIRKVRQIIQHQVQLRSALEKACWSPTIWMSLMQQEVHIKMEHVQAYKTWKVYSTVVKIGRTWRNVRRPIRWRWSWIVDQRSDKWPNQKTKNERKGKREREVFFSRRETYSAEFKEIENRWIRYQKFWKFAIEKAFSKRRQAAKEISPSISSLRNIKLVKIRFSAVHFKRSRRALLKQERWRRLQDAHLLTRNREWVKSLDND